MLQSTSWLAVGPLPTRHHAAWRRSALSIAARASTGGGMWTQPVEG